LAFHACRAVEGQDLGVAVLVQAWGAFTATIVALAAWAAFAAALATFSAIATLCAFTTRFAWLIPAFGAFATLFAGHALVTCFGAGFGLGFRRGVVVEGGLAFSVAAFSIASITATAVAVLAGCTALAATLAATTFTACFQITFTTLWTLATCGAFATGLNAFGVAFGPAFCAVTTLGAVTTTATATTTAASAIGAATIAALATFARLFVVDSRFGFGVSVAAAEQTGEPSPQACFGFGCFGCWLWAACLCRCCFGRCHRLRLMRRCRRIGQYTFDNRGLLVGGLL
jgi:hypothetical protein